MKARIFIDTDVFLDTILDRKPHAVHSNRILALCEQNEVEGFTSSLVIANLYYILKKLSNHEKALLAIQRIGSIIRILPFTQREIGESASAGFPDFEDGIEHFIALNHGLDSIITRNVRDFRKASLGVFTPREFLQSFACRDGEEEGQT
jgi:predicted nucleic acid-binding protein